MAALTQKAQPYALGAFLNRMQRLSRVPLLVAGDFERGASMRVDGTTVFPHAMAFGAAGDPALARFEGQVTAREARALGVHWLFFPVADVNNNPDNPIINIRSYGEDPVQVSALVAAFIEGTRADPRYRVLTTAKHFPGHGDTAVDTHLNMAVIDAPRERLESVELAALPRGYPGGRGRHHDGAHRGARAGPRRCARHAVARHPDRPAARRDGIQGNHRHRRAGDGRHRAGLFKRRGRGPGA